MIRRIQGFFLLSGSINILSLLILSLPPSCFAQITDVNSKTATPIPGVGHDYLYDMNEIVSPANGSLSIRIVAPTPHERGMNFPIFAYTYDSNGQFNFTMQATPVGCGGAIYECSGTDVFGPNLTSATAWPYYPGAVSSQNINLSFNNGPDNGKYTCSYTGDYIYVDLQGGRHSLGLVTNLSNQLGGGCSFFGNGGVAAANFGGDEQYKAAAGSPAAVIDSHGDLLGGGLTGGEDTNGNYRNGTGRPWSVTYGTGSQLYQPQSMTVPGYSVPYTYVYAPAPASFTGLNSTLVSSVSSGFCMGPQTGLAGSEYALQKLNLPNGQYYEFGYDPVYGLVNSITYPTGAKVSYTWGLNPQSDTIGYIENNTIGAPVATPSTCYYIHDWPAVVERVVSFDGETPALQQKFVYATNWSSGTQWWTTKTTTVTTTDLLRPGQPSYQTVYTYIPFLSYPQDPTSTQGPTQMPLESQIVYKDISGNVLRTVTKVWNSPNQLAAECTTLPNGQTSGKFYKYEPFGWTATQQGQLAPGIDDSSTDQVTDLREYDFGMVSSNCNDPGGTPTRETKTGYASLGNTPYWPSGQYMSDRPATVQVYDHGTRISESDYFYDQTSVASVSLPPIGHDESVYGASASAEPRGNVTTISKQCFASTGSCQNAVTTLVYDDTGQVVSVTDPRGATTGLSYNDSYTSDDGSPTGNTNTYLTKITRPPTNGFAHISTYEYDYEKGELRVSTDENGNTSQYSYNDPWDRLTQSTFPDGGQKTYVYDDAGPNPSVSTTTRLNSSGASETSTTIMDGVGHVLYSELTSDPSGTDTVQSTYDGNGRLWTKTNPYRGSSPPSGTTLTYYYDALGRPIETSEQDGSVLQWCYDGIASSPAVANCSSHIGSFSSGTWVDSSDENGNHWQRTYDSFDRLSGVVEPNGTSLSPVMETDYSYDMLNNLRSVSQWGGSNGSSGARVRSFTYDSLSRLLFASNPETGGVAYSYDQNGNVYTKTDARGVETNYSYDALNRLLSKNYSDGSTPSSCYQYDSALDGIGLLSSAWTQSASAGSCPVTAPTGASAFWTKRSILSYDQMGRVKNEQQFTPSFRASGTPYSPTYSYDYTGNLISSTTGIGPTPTSAPITFTNSYDGAGRIQTVSSSYTNNNSFPATLFSPPSGQSVPCSTSSSSQYAPWGSLWNALYGNNLEINRGYDARLRIVCESDTGSVLSNATSGSGTVIVTGLEQSK